MTNLEPRPGGAPASRSRDGGALEKRAPGKIGYERADCAGFDCVPEQVVEALLAASVLAGTMWTGTGTSPVTKRRRDGSHFQHLEAWWASERRYVEFEALRELAPTGDGRFRPSGAWTVSGRLWDFPHPLVPTSSTWHYQQAERGGGGTKARTPVDPVEALPHHIAAPVAGGDVDAWRIAGRGWATEVIVASRRIDDRIRLLRATRNARSLRSLDAGDWTVETVDGGFRASSPFRIDPDGSRVPQGGSGQGLARREIPPSVASRHDVNGGRGGPEVRP